MSLSVISLYITYVIESQREENRSPEMTVTYLHNMQRDMSLINVLCKALCQDYFIIFVI